MDKQIKEYSKKYKVLLKKIAVLEEKMESSQNLQERERLKAELLKINEEFDLFVIEYAKRIFDVYSKKKIQLKDTYTGEIKAWDEYFGNSFDKLSKSKRECLVGLIENYGAYRLIK